MIDKVQLEQAKAYCEREVTASAGKSGAALSREGALSLARDLAQEALWGINHDEGDVEAVVCAFADDNLGLGPLERLMEDPRITEVMVQCPRGGGIPETFVEVEGKITRCDVGFSSVDQMMRALSRIGQGLGRACTATSPVMDARLPDGSRVLATHHDLSPDGPVLVVRKFREDKLSACDLIEANAMTADVAAFLESAVKARVNMVVTGGTGSGKTTLLNVLASFIPEGERVVSIEDPCELKIPLDDVVRWEARPKNSEGEGAVSIADLVVAALRARPDRIVVGEVRSVEAVDMLQAMTTGHDGSITTLHANDPATALTRLRSMVQEARPNCTIAYVDAMVASAVELIVHTERDSSGHRHISQVTSVEGYRDNMVIVDDIFVRRASAAPGGELVPTGAQPGRARRRMEAKGTGYERAWFGHRGLS